MKRWPVIMLLFVLLSLFALLPGCAPAPQAPAEVEEPIHLKVLIFPFLSFLPFHIAQEEGYYAEQGLEVEFVNLERTTDSTAALAQGQIDVGTGILTVSTLNAIAQGADIRIVADRGYIDPEGCVNLSLMVNESLANATPDQMAGKRFATEEETFFGYFTDKVLAPGGLTLDDIEILVVPRATLGEALGAGELDVVGISEPYVTQFQEAGQGVVWASANDYVPGEQLGIILFGPTMLNDNPEAGRRFMVAYMKAVRDYNQGKTERNLDYMVEFTGLERSLVEQACWHSIRDDLQINVESVLAFQAWAVGRGYYDGGLTVEDFWEPSYIEYAQSVLDE